MAGMQTAVWLNSIVAQFVSYIVSLHSMKPYNVEHNITVFWQLFERVACIQAGVHVRSEERRRTIAKERHREGQAREQLAVRQAVKARTNLM